jgi:SWI/SNF-related matrix-associated actin-dependent regulator 1 of chromatin subfamily A
MTLFPYQEEGAAWLAARRAALLADEMGLGKSAQAIRAADITGAKRVLVICPSIARINWAREMEKFSSTLRASVIHKKLKAWPDSSIIASFEGAAAVEKSGRFDVIIIDEAHYLKNKDAKRTKAILGGKGLVRHSERVWCLTGTPAPNHPGELWPMLFTFGATTLKWREFVERYCETFESGFGLQIGGARRSAIPELKELLAQVMLRRRKEDVMNQLPPITFSEQVVEPGPVDIETSSSFIKYAMPVDRSAELAEMMIRDEALVMQAIENARRGREETRETLRVLEALAPGVSTLRRYLGLQKTEPVGDIIFEELKSGAYDKVVIFAIHRDVIESLRVKLKDFSPVTLYGGFTPEKKQRHIDSFQNNRKTRVMIANIGCAGTAVTLTAAHQVVFIEQDWVPGNNAQAVMRCHRIGQSKPVHVRFFAIAGSLDEKVSRVLRRKAQELTEIFDE